MKSGSPSRPYPEERRLATVMFADIQGFTTLSEGMDFETVSDLIKEVWMHLDQVIESHGGYIDKHIGDEVMAVWGAPESSEDDVEQAVTAALAMHEALEEYARSSSKPGAKQIQLRIGINTGPVLATYLGSRNEYTVIGDTVNVAARIQEQAAVGRVVITDSTYRMVRGLFRVQRMGPLSLRGKTRPIAAYRVLQKVRQPSRVIYRDVGGLETRIVGRETELALLDDLLEEVKAGTAPQFVLVVSESGLGKSRLIMEFTSRVEVEQASANIFFTRGLAETQQIPYYLWKSLWHNRFGMSDDLEPRQARESFTRGIIELWGKRLGFSSAVEAAHLIGNIIGIEWPGSPVLQKIMHSSDMQAQKAFELTRELLSRAAQAAPSVLVLEDLHWADQPSLNLLEYLMRPAATPMPLLILSSSRVEFVRQNVKWVNLGRVIRLNPLELNSSLVKEAYPALENMPEATLSSLAVRAGGNPYFLEEMVKTLAKTDSYPGLDTVPVSLAAWSEHLPGNLQAMLQARLDALPRETRDVALLASVVGRVFWEGAILAAAKAPKQTKILNFPEAVLERVVQNALRQLMREELAFPRAGSVFSGEREFIFKHSLLQDVAYSLIPHKHLHSYHAAVAQWLAERRSPDLEASVAYHFERAHQFTRALQHYERAVALAELRGAAKEAEWLREHIQELRTGDPPETGVDLFGSQQTSPRGLQEP